MNLGPWYWRRSVDFGRAYQTVTISPPGRRNHPLLHTPQRARAMVELNACALNHPSFAAEEQRYNSSQNVAHSRLAGILRSAVRPNRAQTRIWVIVRSRAPTRADYN
eukprot:scaffold72900_cov31-Tisochrysis_lutea.AAC.1